MGMFIRKLTQWTIADVAAWENLRRASRHAARGKRRRPDVEAWLLNEESLLLTLRAELRSGCWQRMKAYLSAGSGFCLGCAREFLD